MPSKVSVIANLSMQVFGAHAKFSGNHGIATHLPKDKLLQLFGVLNTLSGQDLGIDSHVVKKVLYQKAPVAYIDIAENEVYTMGVFIIRPGCRIPLHDHPGMFGIIKVVYGAMKCRSFSRINRSTNTSRFLPYRNDYCEAFEVIPHPNEVLSYPSSDACILSPAEGNFHELVATEYGAAFLDILSPPYDHDLGSRECTFYKDIQLPSSTLLSPSFVKANKPLKQLSPPYNDSNNSFCGTSDKEVNSYVSNDDMQNQLSNQSSTSPSSNCSCNSTNITPDERTAIAELSQEETTDDRIFLTRVASPTDFWCSSLNYQGPSID